MTNAKPIATINRAGKSSGYIIYRGPSLLDGKPIVVVAVVRESKNVKTGNMVQTYVLVDNGVSPVQNARSLADVSVCGGCKHRRGTYDPVTKEGGSCYVNLGQGARSVADGVVRGIYPLSDGYNVGNAVLGRKVRLGTYGDPAAVPAYVWENLLKYAAGHTGYTHQWQTGDADHVKQWCMASVDTVKEMMYARADGWRTFRVRGDVDVSEFSHEMKCPASAEMNKRLTCAQCMSCSGGVDSKKANVVIIVHGSLKNRFAASVAA